jgi:predicted nucleic acid-binding protein
MKLFIDNDVILDVLLERKNFEYSMHLLNIIEKKQVKAFTSPLIFTNSFYIITRLKDKKRAWTALKKIRLLVSVSQITEDTIDKALASEFADFEDAVQYYAALQQKVDHLVTRNKKDYTFAQISIISPQECLALIKLPEAA